MKRLITILSLMIFTQLSFGQLTGTKTIPGDYASIAAAVDALNLQGVGSSGVTFDVAADHTENITVPILLTATGTLTDAILFHKSGSGANPLVTRTDAGTLATSTLGGQGDAIIIIQGSDYVTFDQIDVTASNVGIEYGYYLRKASVTDGCKNVTIKNAVITMTKGTSAYVAGIYSSNNDAASTVSSATGVTVTSTGGRHEDVTITGNTIGNVFTGILLRGFNHTSSPYNFYDQNFTVGASGQGNTIQNYAGNTASTAYGVYIIYHNNANVSYNNIQNTAGGGSNFTSTAYGIFYSSATNASGTLNSNQLILNSNTGQLRGIMFGTTSSGIGDYTCNNNNITISMAGTSEATCIYATGTVNSFTINGNTFNYGAFASTSSSYLIYASTATNNITVSENILNGANKTGASGTFYGYYNSGTPTGGTETITLNNFSNIVVNSGTGAVYPLYSNTSTTQNRVCYGNTVSGINHGGTGTVYGMYFLSSLSNQVYDNNVYDLTGGGTIYGLYFTGTNPTVYNNNIYNLTTSGTTLYGIYDAGTGTTNCYSNQVYNLTSTNANPTLRGFYITTGTSNTVHNNFVSELYTPNANAAIPLAGMYVSGGTGINLYYNTVYLNAGSVGALFGSAAVYASTTPTLDLRNNCLVNVSVPNGTGITAAFQRSTTTLGTYAGTSNYNCFYAGDPESPTYAVFYDGTTAYDMAGFQTLVSPRDAASFRELPPFIDVVSTPYDLHLTDAASSQCESGGANISGITDDFDGDTRAGNAGYVGDGIAPDVGADEFAGSPSYTCGTPAPGNTLTTANGLCLGESITLSLANATAGTGVNYQWQSSEDDITYMDIVGATMSTYTTMPAASLYYKCIVTCQNGPVSVASNPLLITFLNSVTSTTPDTRCGTGTVDLEATGSAGTTLMWYEALTGGSPIGTGSPWTSPVIDETTSFFVGAESFTAGSASVGAGATTSATYSNPFYSLYSNNHTQHLITAAELLAAGLGAGDLTSIALDVTSAGTLPMIDLSVKIAHTAATNMSAFVSPSFTTVYTNASLMPTVGLNVLAFSPAFTWDGTSNIVLEFCHGNPSSTATMSRTVRTDATAYVSTIKVHSTTAVASATICANITSNLLTYSVRPQFIFEGQLSCSSPRSEVVATVTPAPDLTLSADQTICNNTVAILAVTSTINDFDSYIWSPQTNLFTDELCTTPYTGTSATTVYFKSATGVTTLYTCTASNTTTGCANVATSEVTNLPAATTITADPDSHCLTGASTLTANPAAGYGIATFQWQDSPDNLTFTDITGANAITYITPTLTSTTYYKLLVKIGSNVCYESNVATVTVNNPQITGTTPGSVCGTGSVSLEATATEGDLVKWYEAAAGGTALYTGSPFVTPVINTTTTYYVAAESTGSLNEIGGRTTPVSTSGFLTTNWGVLFNVTQALALNSTTIYPAGSGTVTIALQNSSGVELAVTSAIPVSGSGISTPVVVDLGFQVPVGTGYRLILKAYSGITDLIRDGSNSFPYPSPSGAISVTGGWTGSSSSSYYWFYSLNVSIGCVSARTPVVASVTPAPDFSITNDQTICNNDVATLQVTSLLTNFDTYVWSPVDNLFTDELCTTPYAGTNASTVYYKSATGGTITYTCAATTSECATYLTTDVTNLPSSLEITPTPEALCITGSSILTILPTTGYGTATFQWQDSPDNITFTDISGANSISYTTPVITSSTYYKLLVKLGSEICIESASVMVAVNDPQVSNPVPGERCGIGTVSLEATASAGSVLNWYATASGGAALGTGSPFVTPVISTTTSFYVSAEVENSSTASVGPVDNTMGAGGYGAYDYYLIFDVIGNSMNLAGVHVYPQTAGNVILYIANSAGTDLHTVTYAVTTPSVKTYIPVNFNLPQGTDYRIGYHSSSGGVGMYRNTAGATYPYTLDGIVSIKGNSFGNAAYYYYCYDWVVSSACSSSRTEVIATVTPPPALTITGDQDVCTNAITSMTVTSTPGNFNTYTWSPVTGLYTDPDCLVPYVALAHAITVYVKLPDAGITTYTCTGTNTTSECVNIATSDITVIVIPDAPTTTGYGMCAGGSIPPGQGLQSTYVGGAEITGSQTIYIDVASQPVETNAAPGNIVASATMAAIPINATVTSIVITYNGIEALGNSWQSEVRLGLSGALVNAAAAGTGAADAVGLFNYTRTATTGITATNAGGTVNLLYWDSSNDNTGDEATFPLGTSVASIVINYSYPDINAAVLWYTTPTGGTAQGFGTPFDPIGIYPLNSNTPGVYTWYAEVNNGTCYSTRTSCDLEIGTMPTVYATADPSTPVCQGTEVSLTAYPSGGGLPYSYSWKVGEVEVSTLQSFDVTPAETTAYNLTVTDNCSQTASASITVTVYPIPSASASSNSPVCAGSTLELTGGSDIGTSFSWTGPNGFASSLQNPTITSVTSLASGTYSFTASKDGCDSEVSTVNVVVNPTPSALSITPPAPFIAAGSVQQLVASGGMLSGVNILTEDFNGATNTWTTINNSTGGTPADAAWILRPDGYTYSTHGTFHSNDNSQFYQSNSDDQGSGSTTATLLQSPAFSTFGFSEASVNFYHYYRHWSSGSSAKVEASTDGTTWTTLQTYNSADIGGFANFVSASVALTAPFINQPTVYVRFKFDASWGYYWNIDNVSITGTGVAAITWDPYTGLFLDEGATINYAGEATSTVYASPAVTETYTATSTSLLGCESSAEVTVTVILCTVPTGLLATNVTGNSANLQWTPGGGETAWEYVYGVAPLAVPAGSGTATSSNTVNPISGLMQNTDYQFYARSFCDPVFSNWSLAGSFSTPCAVVSDFPWSEGFEIAWPPICWTDATTSDFGWDQSIRGGAHSGTEWAYCNLANSVLITPEINLTSDCRLIFWYRAEEPDNPQNLSVKIGDDVIHQINDANSSTYVAVQVSLSAYTGQTVSVAFTGETGDGGTAIGICLDDVIVTTYINTWTGNVSTAWNNPGNWDAGVVPGPSDRVIIPSNPTANRFPVIASGIFAECYNITINTGATFTVANGGSLDVKNP